MKNIIEKEIKAGNNLIIINFRDNPETFLEIKKLAEKANRQDDLILISPFIPEQSNSVNPFDSYFTPEEMARNICGIYDSEDSDNFSFWIYNCNRSLCENVIKALLLLAKVKEKSINLTIETVKSYISLERIKELRLMIHSIPIFYRSKIDFCSEAAEIAKNLTEILFLSENIFSYVTSYLRNVLKTLEFKDIRKIINNEKNMFLERLESNKKIILVVQSNCLLSRESFYTLGIMILSMFHSYIEKKYFSGGYLAPLSIYIDEIEHYSKHNYCELNKFINLSHKAGIQLYGFPEPTLEKDNNSVVSEKKSRRGRKSRIITKTMS